MACCARGYRSGHQTGFNSNLWKKIELNAENFDLGGNFDTGTHRFSVAVPSVVYHN